MDVQKHIERIKKQLQIEHMLIEMEMGILQVEMAGNIEAVD